MSNMDQSFSEMREKLRLAISSGVLASTDTLNERGSTVAEIICVDSLDLVELVMAFEEKNPKIKPIGDLMRYMDQVKAK
jgi:acyl carrier protein